MIRRPPRSTLSSSSAASDVYKRQISGSSAAMPDAGSILIPILIFGAVGALVFLLGQYYATQAQTQRRLQAASTELRGAEPLRGMSAYIVHRFDERQFHLGADRREKLRRSAPRWNCRSSKRCTM